MIEIVYVNDGLAVATTERIVITLVRSAVEKEFLAASFRAGQRAFRKHPAGVASLTLVPHDAPIPPSDVREEAARYTRESVPFLIAGATVVSGTGFGASTVRSVVMAMTVFTKGPPRKIFATPTEATDWIAQRLGVLPIALSAVRSWSERALGDDFKSLFP